MPSERTGKIKENYDWKVRTFIFLFICIYYYYYYCEVIYEMFHILKHHSSHPFFMGSLELTNDQLPTSVAS